MSIVANKVKGIRCGHCHDVFSAKMTRLHNDANVLAFGERVVGPGLMLEIVDAFDVRIHENTWLDGTNLVCDVNSLDDFIEKVKECIR